MYGFGFFLYDILNKMLPICDYMNDEETKKLYEEKIVELKNSLIAVEFNIEVESYEQKEISILLGQTKSKETARDVAYKYHKKNACDIELENVKNKWRNILTQIQVNTPVESTNIMLNGWLLYQTISSRLLGRTGYYQSGGAFGFRDQLQDVLCLSYAKPEIVKEQILCHAKHQFIEGDVQHWWHEETQKGIRTRFTDDLLWLRICNMQIYLSNRR